MSLALWLAALAWLGVLAHLGLSDSRSVWRMLALMGLAVGLTAYLLICGPPWMIAVARWIGLGVMVAQIALPLLIMLLYPLSRDPDDEW